MQKYQSIISGTNGSVIRNVPVTVIKEDGSLAEIFLDREGQVPAPNPLATDSRGVFYFYATNGRYSLRTSVDGITITDADAVLLNDPEEIATAGPIADAVIRAEAAAQRAEFAVEASGIPDLVSQAQNAVLDANAALQGAQSAAQLADDAKAQAASAKNAAELAQQASDTAKTGAENARSLAEQAADQARVYAESIDPAQFVQKEVGKGLMTDTERTKLAGIAEQATKNAADAALRDRSTHTGTQGMGTITGLSAALDTRVVKTSETGAAILPEGTDVERPAPEDIPAGVAAVRGDSTSLTDYFLELWNRRTGVWDALASRTWVTAAINALNKITGIGAAPYYGARAWVNFNGTGTVAIRASGNVSSITDNGTGDYTVNFITPMPDADFAPVGSVSHDPFVAATVQGWGGNNADKTVSSWRFRTGYANTPGNNWLSADYSAVHIVILR